MEPLSSRRYEIHRVLGKGGMGVVYEAFDSKDQTLVALKTINAGDAEHLYRLKHEFRALADVQHQNIVRFGELSYEEGQWFFSMELVRGENFIDYIRAPRGAGDDSSQAATTIVHHLLRESAVREIAPAPPALLREASFDEERLRAALAQLVSALCAIHGAGHVHRDVKPSNVLVSREGRLVLLDFGLVVALADTGRGESPDDLVGTPAFMAPEQLSGEPGGPEADWYAVGVVLYLALTGTLPFEGSVGDIYRAKNQRDPAPPGAVVRGVPPDLDALCVDLLHRVPWQRPTAEAICARLGLSAPRGDNPLAASAPFVGRGADLAMLARAYADVRAGKGRRVVVEGDPGIGKSALVQRFLAIETGDATVLAGRCYEQESVPFKGLDSVVDALTEHLLSCDACRLRTLLGLGVRYLATVFPVLARVPLISSSVSENRGVESEAGLREQAFRELEHLFDALGRSGPLVIYVDDLQWADADSLALFRRVLLRPSGPPCLFVATLRSGMEPPGWAELSAASEHVALQGLGDEESQALWEAVGPGMTTAREATLRAQALREAAGHPLFLVELARAARSGHEEARHLRLEEVLWRRIQEREPIEQRFMEMLAFAGVPMPCEAVARAADLDAGECLTRLGGLKAAQLVRVTRRGEERLVEPFHDRIRESVVAHLDAEGESRVAGRHLRLGRALQETSDPDTLAQRVFAILQHLDAARGLITTRPQQLEVAGLHLIATRAARFTTAYSRARDHAIEGLALAGAEGWGDAYTLTRDLAIERMEAEYLGGDASAAQMSFEAARRRLTSSDDRAALYASWITLQSTHLRFADALSVGREFLRALGAPLPARVSMAHVLREYAMNRLAWGRRPIDALLGLAPLRDPARESAMNIMMALGPASYVLDTNLFTWMMLRIAGDSMKHGVCRVSSYGFAGYGLVLSAAFGRYTEAASFGRVALALNERFGDQSLAGKLHFIEASYLAPWTRPIPEVREALRVAYDKSIQSGDRAYEIYAVLHLSMLEFFEGTNLATLQATAERGQEISVRRREADVFDDSNAVIARYAAELRGPASPDLVAAVNEDSVLGRFFYRYCRAEIAYLRGDADRAAEHLAAALRTGSRAIFGTLMSVELACLEVLIAARQWDGARAEAPRLMWTVASRTRKLASLARSQPANFSAHHLLARAELMRLLGRGNTVRETLQRAVRAAREQGSPKREAIGLTLAADYEHRSGDAAQARTLHRAASEAYARWGASPQLAASGRGA